jgi:hypothetical protein
VPVFAAPEHAGYMNFSETPQIAYPLIPKTFFPLPRYCAHPQSKIFCHMVGALL